MSLKRQSTAVGRLGLTPVCARLARLLDQGIIHFHFIGSYRFDIGAQDWAILGDSAQRQIEFPNA
jgi:hypothetical protein